MLSAKTLALRPENTAYLRAPIEKACNNLPTGDVFPMVLEWDMMKSRGSHKDTGDCQDVVPAASVHVYQKRKAITEDRERRNREHFRD